MISIQMCAFRSRHNIRGTARDLKCLYPVFFLEVTWRWISHSAVKISGLQFLWAGSRTSLHHGVADRTFA